MTAEDRDYFKSFANAFWSPSSSSEASPQKKKKTEKKTHKVEKEKKHKKEKKRAKEKKTKKTQKEKSKQSSQEESESDEVEDVPAPAAPPAVTLPPASSPPLRLRVSGGTNKSYIQEKSGTKWLLLCNVEAPRVKDHRNCMDLVMKEANQNMQQLSQCDFDGRKTMMSKLRDKAGAVFNNDD